MGTKPYEGMGNSEVKINDPFFHQYVNMLVPGG